MNKNKIKKECAEQGYKGKIEVCEDIEYGGDIKILRGSKRTGVCRKIKCGDFKKTSCGKRKKG